MVQDIPPMVLLLQEVSNACTLHYVSNNSILKDGDLLLIDAGCELENYASDITRTYPINGKFSPAQKDIYQIVLEAQKKAINKVIPGNYFDEPHKAAVENYCKWTH